MKTLIVYAKAGAGHRRAAEAVYAAFKNRNQESDVLLVDSLDYTNPWFRYFYPQAYMFLVRFLPLVWAGIYYILENRLIYALIGPLRRINNRLISQRFVKFLKKERPKVIISTQFFASEIVADLKRRKQIKATLISVVTDFGAHTFWESKYVDVFIVASEDTKLDLVSRGIAKNKIRVLGIPIEPPTKELDQMDMRKKIGLRRDSFTVLIVSGGFGVGPIKELVFNLDKLKKSVKEKVQLIVVCSRNKKLYAKMQKAISKVTIDVKLFGFVTDLSKMMLVSKVIISKSGGLTTSEALACGLPMIVIAPIPGQEGKNCALLVKNGAAIKIDKAYQAQGVIEKLIQRPEELQRMRNQAFDLARPDSANDIAALAASFYN